MRRKAKVVVDLGFRPASYWSEDDPIRLLVSGIQGRFRREYVKEALRDPEAPLPGAWCTTPSLDEQSRRRLGAIHPRMMGGEYLPALDAGEVEIARVSLESTTADVISIRARPLPAGKIGYRVVDEYGDFTPPFELPFEESESPLSLGEFIEFLDGVVQSDVPGQPREHERGAVTGHWLYLYQECGHSAQFSVDFASVESTVYPGLQEYYEQLGREWVECRLREEAAEREAD